MSKQRKLIDRFTTIPSDFTWDELMSVLAYFGYIEIKKGKTAGPRRKLVDEKGNILLLHKPHPANVVKKYVLRQVLEFLNEKGNIGNE